MNLEIISLINPNKIYVKLLCTKTSSKKENEQERERERELVRVKCYGCFLTLCQHLYIHRTERERMTKQKSQLKKILYLPASEASREEADFIQKTHIP